MIVAAYVAGGHFLLAVVIALLIAVLVAVVLQYLGAPQIFVWLTALLIFLVLIV